MTVAVRTAVGFHGARPTEIRPYVSRVVKTSEPRAAVLFFVVPVVRGGIGSLVRFTTSNAAGVLSSIRENVRHSAAESAVR